MRLPAISIFFTLLFVVAKADAQDSLYYSIVSQDGWFKAIDRQGHTLADSLRTGNELYMGYDRSAEGMFVYLRNQKIGFKDYHNRIVVPPAYDLANLVASQRFHGQSNPPTQTVFFRGQAVVGTGSQTFGIIDRKGRLIADTVYSWISTPEPGSGRYVARIGRQLMVLDRKGRNILSNVYVCDTVLYPTPAFYDGLLCVMVPDVTTGKDGDPRYDGFGVNISSGVRHGYKAGFVDASGKLVIDTVFTMSSHLLGNKNDDYHWFWQSVRGCGTGRAKAAALWKPYPDPFYLNKDYYRFEAGKCLANRNGHDLVINLQGDSLFAISKNHRVVNERGYFICQTREFLGSSSLNTIYNPYGKLLPVFKGSVLTGQGDFFLISDGMSGGYLMDGNGNRRFDNQYEVVTPFHNGFAQVNIKSHTEGLKEEKEYGFLDTNGRFYPSKRYRGLLRSGYVIISRDMTTSQQLYGVMDENQKWIIRPKYTELMPFNNGLAQVSGIQAPSGKWGFINEKFEIVISEAYDRVNDFFGTIVP